MKLLHGALAALLLALASSASARCDLTLDISAPRTSAATLPWAACGTNGIGVQKALDTIAEQGGGKLLLSGAGSLLVGAPLFVGSNTFLGGDPARRPYGMLILGADTRGYDYRIMYRPVLVVYDAENVTIHNLEFQPDGDVEDRGLHGPAVGVLEARGVLISQLRSASVQMGFAVKDSEDVTLQKIDLTMVRSRQGRPEGGAGVWFRGTRNAVLEHSSVRGDEYYAAGPPNNTDYRPLQPDAAPAMDLVSVHGGKGNVIRYNQISGANAAGIYANCFDGVGNCPPEYLQEDLTVLGNQLSHFRQHGVDLAHNLRPLVRDNTVSRAEMALVALGDVHHARILDNQLSHGGLARGGADYGALYLLWGSSDNVASGNEVSHADNYALYLKPASQGFPDPQRNHISGNRLGEGVDESPVGGVTKGNHISR